MAECRTCGAPIRLWPDGDPKYDPPRGGIERLEAALENEAIVTRDLKEELERVTKERNEWQEKFMALVRASMIVSGE